MVLALVIVACILLLLAAVNIPAGRVSLGWLGLFFWVLSTIWGKL
jgi:hypothetical protein